MPTIPIEFHSHGIKKQDFSSFQTLDLETVNKEAEQENIFCILTISLPKDSIDEFIFFMQLYSSLRKAGKLSYIVGISLEGPLLSSVGGTPERGSWVPTKQEWEKIARCGSLGLRYTVLSPDAMLPGSCLSHNLKPDHPDIAWIIEMLLQHNISPALGHFQKNDPNASVECIQTVLDVAKKLGNKPFSGRILTDHVFNDMPLNFRHAWRTTEDKKARNQQFKTLQIEEWTMENLDERLGNVPAILLQSAHAGLITLCINFDGAHVDLGVCRRVVELVGSQSIIAITDRTDTNSLGGERLWRKEGTNLWYQDDGIVAAGMSSMHLQMQNMLAIGLNEKEIWDMIAFVPERILGLWQDDLINSPPDRFSYVAKNGVFSLPVDISV
ncbi:N-acetylglucosamine-6-phosphate deacetylase [Dictyobacter kobayashii]|uniref:N-acetylglucosamine-6-phosphate deacetylase n=1 Tax=Dictyobacter kobayashii TaxID=2014872 RepID=A0A402AC95_9CHLR|nr:N-acetylglucosamine-6-phosphate deacetylase [Dictyobacter kobayashii]GCE16708.1 hypothetical protein KDK_05080 [Dictyobacter kobayashii]